ncbi:hypothetical protein ACGFYV_26095 [Streptomyces sp. NPDC048297]|uniref:hypothetical protein n=1 Tax=Streptomyces sp. NPDC048297 TaxID=3365531 RepID=UPI003712FD00
MRPITGADVIDFYNGRDDLLVLTSGGEFTTIDYSDVAYSSMGGRRADAYSFVATEDGDEVQVLLERSSIDEGEWFPDALDDEDNLIPSVADEMADIINSDGILPSRAMKAVEAGRQWKKAEEETNQLALERAKAVAEVVAFCGGNQSAAARLLVLDQSTVNKLVKKAQTV